jgi:predicted transposase YbfD/YdcC
MSIEQREAAIMNPKKWNLRAIIKGVKAKNPYTYDDGYKYHKFRPPADVVDTRTNHVGFDPYIDVPVDAEPGLYRIVLRIIDWPRLKGLAGMFTRMDVTQFEELDYNYVELTIPKKVPPSAKSVIKGKVVDHDHPETPIKGATVWIQLSDTPDFKEKQDYTENGELVKYITKADGMFELKGLFGQKFVQVYATTENGGEGYHKTPPEPFKCPPDRDDVIVPMVFPAAEPGFKIPEPISKDIKDNLDKIMLIAQGKIGAQKLPPEVRGLGNHARKVIEQMMKEIEEHNSEVAKKGASKYKHNAKPSSPRGLNNFKEGRFFGFLRDVEGGKKMSILNIEKFIFGSGKEMLIDFSGKGWMFKTKGMTVDWMVDGVLAGDVGVTKETARLIDEKKTLFEEYIQKLKDVESQIDKRIHEAYSDNDKQLFTLYEKMKTCFTNIRQYIESHRVVEGLETIKMYLEDPKKDLKKYIESWDPKGADNMQRSPSYGPESWEYRLTGMKKDVRTEYPAQEFGLVQAVDEVVAVLKKHINDLRIELNSTIPVVEGNYAELKKDIQQFQELHRSRAQARAGIRAA